MSPEASKSTGLLSRADLHRLFEALKAGGYRVVGPTLRGGAVVYDDLDGPDDLPAGWTDRQEAGSYRVERRGDEACFGYVLGPHTWKGCLHPPEATLFEAERTEDGFRVAANREDPPGHAFMGVRPCELRAMAVQDKVLTEGLYADPLYAARRAKTFVVAVNCTEPGGTCFCASMKTGPRAEAGYDLVLTELLDGDRHRFLVGTGSERGEGIFRKLPTEPAAPADLALADDRLQEASRRMGREMDTEGIEKLLEDNLESLHWERVAERCLACTSCTMVCPTCFCTNVEDFTDLTGTTARRVRRWDSCFTDDFSYIHGGSIRSRTSVKYRQWITHKLANWHGQFGTSGCVGCGRCITWCPSGIDITEEVKALRAQDTRIKEPGHGNP